MPIANVKIKESLLFEKRMIAVVIPNNEANPIDLPRRHLLRVLGLCGLESGLKPSPKTTKQA